MAKLPIIKSLTLLCFVALLASFVAYKGGYFDSVMPASNNGKNKQLIEDIIAKQPDKRLVEAAERIRKAKTIMPSSKSLVISKNIPVDTATPHSEKEDMQIISSTKSSVIISKVDFKYLQPYHFIKIDTSVSKKAK